MESTAVELCMDAESQIYPNGKHPLIIDFTTNKAIRILDAHLLKTKRDVTDEWSV